MVLVGAPGLHAADIAFSPATTQAEFDRFSLLVAQAIFPTPVEPARATGLAGFDIGVAATGVKVDRDAAYWKHAVSNDFTTNGYVGVPRLVASKGLGMATVSGSLARVTGSGITVLGGAVDVPVIRGTVASPELAVRASFATVSGAGQYDSKVYGLETFVSKGFGPVTPYAAVGRMRADSTGTIHPGGPLPDRKLAYKGDVNRMTVGVRVSLAVPRIAIEVTKAEVTSYAAKVSFGF